MPITPSKGSLFHAETHMLIPAALGLGLLGLGAFFWALRSGQFEDLDGAAHRILFDDEDDQPQSAAHRLGRRAPP